MVRILHEKPLDCSSEVVLGRNRRPPAVLKPQKGSPLSNREYEPAGTEHLALFNHPEIPAVE